MKKFLFPFFIFLFTYQFVFSQEKLNNNQKLESFCKVWGFLKYYHPEIASGKRNCDDEFFNILKEIEKVENKKQLSTIYISWINSLGEIKSNEKIKESDNQTYFDKNFDLSWLENETYFTSELINKLKFIKDHRFQGSNYYVKQEKNGVLNFTNEKEFQNDFTNDNSIRLLSLFRYWNMVEYFYPYKYLTDKKWDDILLNFIPKYESVTNKEDYILLIKELISSLDDTHVTLKIDDIVKKRVPFKISEIEGKPVVSKIDNDSLAKINDIRLGDIILDVNGKPIDKLYQDYNKYVPASNLPLKSLLTYAYIINKLGKDSVLVKISRNEKIFEKKIFYYKNSEVFKRKKTNKPWRLIDNQTGYINFGLLEENDVPEMIKDLFKSKYLIFDLRNYPNYHTYLFSKLFESRKKFSTSINAYLKYPGRFTTKDNFMGVKNNNCFKGEIILLVNELTLSRSEYMAMVFQAYDNVVVIGTQTAGTDGDVINFNFVEGFTTGFTGTGVLYPDGTQAQRKGLKIDIPVTISIKGLINNKDEILEKAFEYINEIK